MLRASICAALASLAAAAVPVIPTLPLPGGVQIPTVMSGSCCGAYNISSYLAVGGRAIDTSCDYGSQPSIAAAIAASGIPRSDIWITSKLNVESCGYNMTEDLYSQVLGPLQTTYVDLLLLHHAGRFSNDNNPRPPCFNASLAGTLGAYYQCRMDTVLAFADMMKQGLIRSWGVSNWNVRDLLQCNETYGFFPPVNQIEVRKRAYPRSLVFVLFFRSGCWRSHALSLNRKQAHINDAMKIFIAARRRSALPPPSAAGQALTLRPMLFPVPRTRCSSTPTGRRARSSPSATATASSSRPTRPSATTRARP